MRLVYLPANAAWAFVAGSTPVRIGRAPMMFESRAEALRRAHACRLCVYDNGQVGLA